MGEERMVRRLRRELDKAKTDPKGVAGYFLDRSLTVCVDAYMTKQEIQDHIEQWWKIGGEARYQKNMMEKE